MVTERRAVLKLIGVGAATITTSGSAFAQGDEPAYGDWFDDVENYEETEDATGMDEVTVDVGTGDRGLLFDPPAVRVDQGTTVVWVWTGEGGGHNVVHTPDDEAEIGIEDATGADEPAFESETESEEGFTFEHTFEEPGTYLYVCEPHRTQGMKGAVVVDG